MAGKTMMYTSGWPNTQNKWWYKVRSDPANTSKSNVPKMRSNRLSSSATVMTGNENTMRNDVTNVVHANMGMRMRLMPGADRKSTRLNSSQVKNSYAV